MARLTIPIMIVQDMGYCCPFFFFSHYRRTALIAARLGVSDRAVRYHKEELDAGRMVCAKAPGCLHARITLGGFERKVKLP